jgi:hypothetical protein
MSSDAKSFDEAARMQEFADRLAKGDFDALLRRFGGDMAYTAARVLIDKISDDTCTRMALALKYDRMRIELAGSDPTPIQRALAEKVAVCYLDTYYSDILAQANACPELDRLVQQRQDRAMRRYTHAIGKLAEIRKVESETIDRTVRQFRVVG